MFPVDDDDADNKPILPSCAVGALFRGARRFHINLVRSPTYNVFCQRAATMHKNRMDDNTKVALSCRKS
jgi:hypothetical protein